MEASNIQSLPFFEWLLRTSLQGSLLICLILLVKSVLRDRLPIRWHYYLWFLLLVRLAMPWAPQSRISIFNLVPQYLSPGRAETFSQTDDDYDAEAHGTAKPLSTKETAQHPAVAAEQLKPTTIESKSKPTTGPAVVESGAASSDRGASTQSFSNKLFRILPLVWLIGAIVLAGYVAARNFSLWRTIKRERPVTDQKILDLLEDCKMQLRVQTVVGVVVTDRIKSPALFGFVRPRLLLPQGLIEALDLEELHYVFLHELAHLKRRDIYLGWLVSLLQVMHWFNPLIWFGLRRMRTDQELACDGLVLTTMNTDEPPKYGRTIVNLFERFSQVTYVPSIAGILEDKSQLERRVKMIARFKKNSYQWSPLAVILIIILACVSLPDAKRTKASVISAAKPARHITLRQVWSGPGVTYGAPSPDGRYLSYVDWETGDLAIYEIATGKKRRLTNKGTWDESDEYAYSSRWSPDSTQIAYQWCDREGHYVELCVRGLEDSEHHILYSIKNRNEWIEPHDWSPDGKHILACLSEKDGNKIVLVSAADGSVRVLKTLYKFYPRNMCFSPDGRYIVYSYPPKEDSPERDISLLTSDGSREISLVKHPADDYVLGWGPDGKNILFASDRTGSLGAWLIAVAEGKPQGAPELVKADIGRFQPMGFTRDGSFYYGQNERKRISDIYIAELDPETGEILAPPKRAITRFEGSNEGADYSPDGKYLSYVSIRRTMPFITAGPSHPIVLCIYSLETGEERELFPKLKAIRKPRWSPDCRSFLVKGMDYNNRRGIFQMDAQTGDVTPIVLSDEYEKVTFGLGEWSRDGKAIFYARRNDTNNLWQIIFRDLETGIEKVLYHASEKETFHFRISPDGNWLALNIVNSNWLIMKDKSKRVLKIIPAAGGEPRELYRFEERILLESLLITWTADGKYILFARKGPSDQRWELCRISADGGEPEKLGLEMRRLFLMSVHPDGQHIAFKSTAGRPAEVWVMENFLPGAPVAKSASATSLRMVTDRWKRGYISLHTAARQGLQEELKKLIEKGTDVNAKDSSGQTALHYAAREGYKQIVEVLLAHGADVNAKGARGQTALHYAAPEGHKEIVEVLLAHGADVNIGNYLNQTPAEYAMLFNHNEVVELLVSKGADISPLHFALYMKDEAKAKSLIEGGADVNKRTPFGITPLHMAAVAGFKDIAELLIEKGADVNAKPNWDWTPLHGAVKDGNEDIVELLIAKGADVNARDGDGRTPLSYAQDEGHTKIVELLRKHGAKE